MSLVHSFHSCLLACVIFLGNPSFSFAQIEPQGTSDQRVKVLVAYHSLTGNTKKMAQGVVDGAKSVFGTDVELKRVGEITGEQLFGSDALVVGSPVYWSNMAGEVKTFFDNWQFQFGVFPDLKMRNKVGSSLCNWGTNLKWKGSDHADHPCCHAREPNDSGE